MTFKEWLLSEVPISGFDLEGPAWEKPGAPKHNYTAKDIGILTSPKGVEKIKKKWEKVPQNFDLYFLRAPGAGRHVEEGEVDEKFLKGELNLNIPINRSNITVIYTNNLGTEKMPMNAWTIAHRFGHAVRQLKPYQYYMREVEKDFNHLLSMVYGQQSKSQYQVYDRKADNDKKHLAHALGTMGSARKKALVNFGEFNHELLAQYITQGNIKFNKLPRMVPTRYAWGNPIGMYARQEDREMNDEYVEYMAEKYESDIDMILNHCVGKIFVM